MANERIQPESLYEASHYSHAVKAGDTVYISGQVPKDAQGELVGPGDVVSQTHQVFQNLEAVLGTVGCTFNDLVKYTIYTTSLAFKAAIGEIRAMYLKGARPASTFVVVSSLASPEFLLEVEAIALVP